MAQSPVTTEEFRGHLRRPVSSQLESQLQGALDAATEWFESFSGRKIDSFDVVPAMVKQAILLRASDFFENPVDSVSERTTAAMRLADPLIWQETTT